jgi:hypothetical protein
MEKTYQDFLESKRHTTINYGIEPKYIPDFLFDYQKHVTEYAVKKGRCAVFLDTGLGKTLIELTIARNYVEHTNKNVLIITPLAVAFQFVKESERFGVIDIEYSKDGNYKSKVVVCNYERLDKFNPLDFDCVILDESSILKNFNGAIKSQVTAFLKKVKYRYLFTATPSPNDFIELGTSSEALGYMGYMDMLTKFFTNNEDTIKPQNIGTKWILKGHAKESFFQWVSSWSISMRKPSDLGFSNKGYELPELITNKHSVKSNSNLIIDNQPQMFLQIAKSLSEIKSEQRNTITDRCERAYELASQQDTSVYWCNFNKESELLNELDKDSYEIRGSMSIDKKEELLVGFSEGHIKKLITKPKMTAFGLNWQHCNHTTYFPTFSYEQYYQSIRRFWRFGQKKPVTVELIYSEGQKRVMDGLIAKAEKSNRLFSKLNDSINSEYKTNKTEFNKTLELPSFLGRK